MIAMHGRHCIENIQGTAHPPEWLAYAQWDNHAYFFKSARPFLELKVMDRPSLLRTRVRMDQKRLKPPKAWPNWEGELVPGCFLTAAPLRHIREKWLCDGVVAEGTVTAPNEFTSITRSFDDGTTLTLKSEPAHLQEMEIVFRELEVPYTAGSLATATLQAVEHLVKPKRAPVSEAERIRLLVLQKYQCACGCGKLLKTTAAHADHLPRICESRDGSVRMLDAVCHMEKCSEEL